MKRQIEPNFFMDVADKGKKNTKLGTRQEVTGSSSDKFRVEESRIQKQDIQAGISAPCKIAVDTAALKSLQNTPRKKEQTERAAAVYSSANAAAKAFSNSPDVMDKKIDSAQIKLSSNPTITKTALTANSSASLKASPTFSSKNISSVQNKQQDTTRSHTQDTTLSNTIRKTQSPEESVADTENSSDTNEGFRSKNI